jgi:hypothetical protein
MLAAERTGNNKKILDHLRGSQLLKKYKKCYHILILDDVE